MTNAFLVFNFIIEIVAIRKRAPGFQTYIVGIHAGVIPGPDAEVWKVRKIYFQD